MGKWVTPPTIPGEFYCRELKIPDDPYLIGAVMGALWPLAYAGNWEQGSGACTPADTAAAMLAMLWEAYGGTGNCGGDMDVRQGLLDPCILEKSLDGGETWEPFADLALCAATIPPPMPTTGSLRVNANVPEWSPDSGTTWIPIQPYGGSSPTVPPLVSTPGGDDNARACLASTRAALVLSEFYRATFGGIGAGVHNALLTMNNFLTDLNHALFNLVWSPYEGILEAELFRGTDWDTYWQASALGASDIQALTCHLLDNASVDAAGVVTFDFTAVYNGAVAALGTSPGTELQVMLAYIEQEGLNRAGNVEITESGSCEACDDCDYGGGYKLYHTWLLPTSDYCTNTAQGTVANYAGGRTPDGYELRDTQTVTLDLRQPVCVYAVDTGWYATAPSGTFEVYADGVLVTSDTVTTSGATENTTGDSTPVQSTEPVSEITIKYTGGGYQGYRGFLHVIKVYVANSSPDWP